MIFSFFARALNLVAFIVVLLLGPGLKATDESPPQDISILRSLIEKAVSAHLSQVVIPPGVYRGGPAAGSGTCITLKNAQGITVMAEGVRLICTHRARAFALDNCQGVTLQGITIDYDPLPFTQGDVVNIAPDGTWVDVRIHQGYQVQGFERLDLIDSRTLHRKRGTAFLWNPKIEVTGPDMLRVHQRDLGSCARIGDYMTLSTGPEKGCDAFGIYLENCSQTTLRNVTLHSANSFGIADHGGEGGTHIVDCHIVPGPPPAGATIPPLLSTVADGINHNSCRKGPLVENCTFAGCGDDTWSVSASDYLVLANDGKSLLLTARDSWAPRITTGDRLQQELDGIMVKAGQVQSGIPRAKAIMEPNVRAKLNDPKHNAEWDVADNCDQVTLDQAVSWKPGTTIWSPDRDCAGAVFRNNFVHSSGRILLRGGAGSHALIEGNTLIEPHAVILGLELAPHSAAGIEDVTIRNNTIVGSGYFCQAGWNDQAGAISVIAPLVEPHPIYRNIVISGNILRDTNGLGILIGEANHVTIQNNLILATHQKSPPPTGACIGVDQHAAIYILQSNDVTFTGNLIKNPGPFLTQSVITGAGVTGLTSRDTGVTMLR